jgi:hypothetical protein
LYARLAVFAGYRKGGASVVTRFTSGLSLRRQGAQSRPRCRRLARP